RTIWLSEADSTGMRQLSAGPNDFNPACSPDGKWVYYLNSGPRQIMKVPLAGGSPQIFSQVIVENVGSFDFAPDGRTMVLGTYDFKVQRPNFSILSTDTGQVLKTYEYDSRQIGQLRFDPEGKAIVYLIHDKGVDN